MKALQYFTLINLCTVLVMTQSAFAQNIIDPRTPDGFLNPESKRLALNSEKTSFKVPRGKNLYITRMTLFPAAVMGDNTILKIDGKSVFNFNKGTELCSVKGIDKYLNTPVIIGSESELTLEGKGSLFLEVFTVDAEVSVKIITQNESLQIPANKTFVLLHTVLNSSCNVAYTGSYEFSEIDELHFPEFIKDANKVNKEMSNVLAMFGYFY